MNIARRKLLAAFAGAAAWPFAARAQQAAMPVVGYLSQSAPEAGGALVAAVRKGLAEVGIVEGRDVTSEMRWARYDLDRLPGLAADLVQRRVAVIITLGTPPAARAAKAATSEILIVFALGTDPVQVSLVESLNHPGGNVTGISTMNLDIAPKWVELLHELLPTSKRFATLVNIQSADSARAIITGTQAAGFALGTQIEILFANNQGEIDTALAGLGARAQGLIIHSEVLFLQNMQKLAALAVREKLSAIYSQRAFPEASGLMSYGSSFLDAHRQVGVYAGRILKGEKPGNLPVQRATKFELVINLKTAKTIAIDMPPQLLARADEVIE